MSSPLNAKDLVALIRERVNDQGVFQWSDTQLLTIANKHLQVLWERLQDVGQMWDSGQIDITQSDLTADGRNRATFTLPEFVGQIKYVEANADGTVDITMSPRGAFVRICIRDNGPGIDPTLLDEVFEPFRRASPGTGGTGLGLSIVRRYVTTMGGRVWLESDGRTGTTAVVDLPSATAGGECLAA